jgi:glycosyltransferase involved in cell wall biosynthesis
VTPISAPNFITKRVSVIIPAFNAAPTIKAAIYSALHQRGVRVDVIVVDDASTDETAEIVTACAQLTERVSLVRFSENNGPAAARNEGLRSATGEWIAILDADDEFCDGRLERLVALGKREQADFVADNIFLVDEKSRRPPDPMIPVGEANSRIIRLTPASFVINNISRLNSRGSFGFLKPIMRRSYIEQQNLSYDQQLRFAEDYDLYLRALLVGARFIIHLQPGYRYRVGSGSLVASNPRRNFVAAAEIDTRFKREAWEKRDAALVDALRQKIASDARRAAVVQIVAALHAKRILPALALLASHPSVIAPVGRRIAQSVLRHGATWFR